MNSIYTLSREQFPLLLKEIYKPPSRLFVRGTLPDSSHVFLTIVGSRNHTDYGKEVVRELIAGLRGLPVVIVSGMAYGIDAIAHREALKNKLLTVAIPGSGLDTIVLYPREHRELADTILRSGGCLISPFENTTRAARWTFPERNRIMAGISHATLVIESELRGGTLITSSYAGEYNRQVCAVPGPIFSKKSTGPHMLIKKGATPITSVADLREALGFKQETSLYIDTSDISRHEKLVLDTLTEPLDRDELCEKTHLDPSELSIALSLLEMRNLIREILGKIMRV